MLWTVVATLALIGVVIGAFVGIQMVMANVISRIMK